MAAEFN